MRSVWMVKVIVRVVSVAVETVAFERFLGSCRLFLYFSSPWNQEFGTFT